MAAITGTLGECCVKEIRHTGESTGKVMKIGDLQSYVAYPPSGVADTYPKILIYFADAFGSLWINSQLIMDWFAKQGFLVVSPEYLEGDAVNLHFKDLGFNMGEWLTNWADAKIARARETTPPWIEALKKQYGNPETKYFTLGYCMGGSFVLESLAQDWVSAGVTAHPVGLTEDHFRNAKKPLLLQSAAVDPWFPLDSRVKAERIMVEAKSKFHIQVYAGVNHGFALRGNMDDPEDRWAKEAAAKSALDWFKKYGA